MPAEAPLSSTPFSPRALRWIIGLGSGSLLLGLVIGIFGEDLFDVPSSGADAYSRSAVGHRLLVDLLKELDVPVLVSRHATAGKVRDGGLLLMAEPRLAAGDEDQGTVMRLERLLDRSAATLVVLPKWTWRESLDRRGWIAEAMLRPPEEVERVLEALGTGAAVVRRPGAADPPRWSVNPFTAGPALTRPQLVTGPEIEPIVACDEGILVGEIPLGPRKRLVVLSDPDLLSNHGLSAGENARFAIGLVESLRPQGGVVVVDETLHGFSARPGVFRELFDEPLLWATLQALLALALILAAAMGRFGAPVPLSGRREPGNEQLIDNTAELIRFAGHSAHSASRYARAVVKEVGRTLHAPPRLHGDALLDWLAEVSRGRGLEESFQGMKDALGALERPARERGASPLRHALAVHRWKESILDVARED